MEFYKAIFPKLKLIVDNKKYVKINIYASCNIPATVRKAWLYKQKFNFYCMRTHLYIFVPFPRFNVF